MAYYFKYFQPEENETQLEKYLNSVFEDLAGGLYQPSYCQGVSGMLYVLNHLGRNGFIRIEMSEAESCYANYLKTQLEVWLKEGYYDFLHGALGIVYYFLSSARLREDRAFFQRLTEGLLASALSEGSDKLYWEDKFDGVASNISLAHGMSSLILILSYIYRSGLGTLDLRRKIDQAVHFILAQQHPPGGFSCYPNINRTDDFTTPRLAWCYGDLGIGAALWQVSVMLERKELGREAVRIFKAAENRKDMVENRVYDACFCHGSAGISHLFRWMYEQTGIASFLPVSRYWLNKTIEFSTGKDSDSIGFKCFMEGKYEVADMSLLDGISGIGMVLMSAVISPEKLAPWGSIFLLNRLS